MRRPWKNLRRRSTGFSFQRRINRRVKCRKSRWSDVRFQFVQLISLSWQYALLLPCCVRPSSSPPLIIGTPTESSSVAIRLRRCCSRIARIRRSSVGPSTPQFQLRLWFSPSALFSPFASLCLSRKLTRSARVKPSCAVMKLTLAHGRRPLCSYRSLLPERRVASSEMPPPPPRQKRRTVSRYFPFHSVHLVGKLPT